jgi:transposase
LIEIAQNIDKDDIIGLDIFQIKHFPILSSFIDELGLVEFIDQLLPKTRDHKISHGEAFKFLILSAFTVYPRDLYHLYQVLHTLPLFLCFNRDIDIDDFNDDALAKFLEAVDEYGPSVFFSEIVQHIAPKLDHMLDFDVIHSDIINFTVCGQYKYADGENVPEELFKIVHGYPKDKRTRLKCLGLALIANSSGAPIYMKPLSGNCSDNKELNLHMRQFLNSIKNCITVAARPLFIADAAFYCKNNIGGFPANFIARVPETITEAKDLKYKDVQMKNIDDDAGYSYYASASSYGDVGQIWVLFHSAEMADKQTETFERKLEKELSKANGSLRTLGMRSFACEEDAIRESKLWISNQKWCQFESFEIMAKETGGAGKKGRRKKGGKLVKNYYVRGTIVLDEEAVERERLGLGRFILATNDLSLSPKPILKYYKEQSKVEKCFRYIKSNGMRISEILLKKPERVQGLLCFMALAMLVYSILEARLQNGLKKTGKKIADNSRKKANKPSLQLAFSELREIFGMIAYNESTKEYIFEIRKRRSKQFEKVIEQFGGNAVNIYKNDKIKISKRRAAMLVHNARISDRDDEDDYDEDDALV